MGLTLTMPEETIENVNPDPVHWVWDDDPDESCCGLDMSGSSFVDDEGPEVDCQNCLRAIKFVEELERNLNG